MNEKNGADPGVSRGIDRLRETIEDVAGEIETRPALPAPRKPLRLALGVAALLVVLLLGSWWILPRRASEVEVLELRIRGRDVRARIVDDTRPDTIVVILQSNPTLPVGAACIAAGGSR